LNIKGHQTLTTIPGGVIRGHRILVVVDPRPGFVRTLLLPVPAVEVGVHPAAAVHPAEEGKR
jgi:hypothetical protein